MKMKVIYTDGKETEVTIGPRAQTEVERKYDVLYTDIFDNDTGKARVERFYYAAWAALFYSGLTDQDDFDEWLNTISDVVPAADGEATNPTRRARRPAKSST